MNHNASVSHPLLYGKLADEEINHMLPVWASVVTSIITSWRASRTSVWSPCKIRIVIVSRGRRRWRRVRVIVWASRRRVILHAWAWRTTPSVAIPVVVIPPHSLWGAFAIVRSRTVTTGRPSSIIFIHRGVPATRRRAGSVRVAIWSSLFYGLHLEGMRRVQIDMRTGITHISDTSYLRAFQLSAIELLNSRFEISMGFEFDETEV